MFGLLRSKKAQSSAEYAILIGLVIAVVIAMQTYVKRGVQGRLKDAADDFTTGISADTNWVAGSNSATLSKQYEPEGLSSKSTQELLEDTQASTMAEGGAVTRESTRRTTQASGDYQTYNYTTTNTDTTD